MTRLLNVATPLTACAVAVVPPPAKTPPLSVSVTVDVSLVATDPPWFSTETCKAGLRDCPAVPDVGDWEKASLLVPVAVMLMLEDPAPVSDPSLTYRL